MSQRHRYAAHFLKLNLLSNISGFAELETRIAALPNPKDRGDAFEVFAEAYLATQKIVQARRVWPLEHIPENIRRRLSIRGKDMGVDGVYETPLGDYNAYQVKFRTGRAALTWEELSTFMGLTDQVSQRVLFTNCDDLPRVMNDRSGFFPIRGSDLDRLEVNDFGTILRWLETGNVVVVRKQPRPHQTEALQKILPALRQHDRTTAVLACGTGKTLLALWVAERMECKTVLVLVPSLALVRQTLHEWLKETSWPKVSFLCVCSDRTVAKDADDLIVRQSDADFPVTTDSTEVRRWFKRPFSGVRLVFSTYQSAEVVAKGMKSRMPFDLGIFDEAHKTTGREGTRFSFALQDKNLPIRKRLFMTATPRHYDMRHKDKEGDAKLVYSMDVPDVYGLTAHTLTFAEAARREIICDYKVIISVVTSDMVNEELLRKGEVIVKGDAVKAKQVANQIALQEVVKKYGVSRIFTFHRNVASAESFTSSSGEGIQSHLPKFSPFHVNGAMPTAKRERIMREFAEARRAVMSNARCLTEGVDVPAVDMIAFMSPKKSRVDIVQAAGRAMRKVPNKETGYVLVPVFQEMATGETVEEASTRSGFEDVWDVLEAMKEQDEMLADVIRQMREDRGRIGGYDDSRFRKKVEVLGPSLSLESLQAAITAECVERLGTTWDERYGELKTYTERFGDCRIPLNWSENPHLATWVNVQRRARKGDGRWKLTEERINRLDALGFIWDPLEASWQEMFAALSEYKKTYGHYNVPKKWPKNPQLAVWVVHQRTDRVKGRLREDRVLRLDEISFTWNPHNSSWDEMFEALLRFKSAEGHCDVPRDWSENPRLARWVAKQREGKRTVGLSKDRAARLNDVGFAWDPTEAAWEEMFAALVSYRNVHGHCQVPRDWPESPQLPTWVVYQRQAKNKRKLSKERIVRLNEIGFVWDALETSWEKMFAALLEYRKAYGHCDIPVRFPENLQLGTWVGVQRRAKRKGELSQKRIERLNAIEFIWDALETSWQTMFSALVAYKRVHNNCNVPAQWAQNPLLGRWISAQRTIKKRGKLSKERIRRLEALGFSWGVRDKK